MSDNVIVARPGTYESYAPIGERRINRSGGVRSAASKMIGNY
ncbi:MAG: hypothetical protein WD845_12495 [Pirellulales bacterium]